MAHDITLIDLVRKFCHENPVSVYGSILFSIASHTVETLIIPKLLAEIFTSVDDMKLLKRNIIIFLIALAVEKLLYMISNYLSSLIEPALTTFLTTEFVRAVLVKYETTHSPIEIAITMDKINVIRTNLEDVMYYACFKLIPLIAVLIITGFNIFRTNKKLGICVFIALFILGFVLYNLSDPDDTIRERDTVNEFIEDIFQNLELVSSTQSGITRAYADMIDKIKHFYDSRLQSVKVTTFNQNVGYVLSFVLYVFVILYLYSLYSNKEVTTKQFEMYLLVIGRVFEITYGLAYYLPSFIRSYLILKTCDDFVRELFSYSVKPGLDLNTLATHDLNFGNVSFAFNNNTILDRFSIAIPSGSLVALYGPSGSGKSTFANLVLDNIQPSEGNIYLDTHNLKDLNKNSIKKYITSVKQNTTSLLQTSIYDNITYGLEQTPQLKAEIYQLVHDYNIVDVFGDVNFFDIIVSKGATELSGGQKQIIHLLHCAFNPTARVIILDEPTSALDEQTKRSVIDIIRHLHNQGKTILIITHDPEVRNICQRVILFNRTSNPIVT